MTRRPSRQTFPEFYESHRITLSVMTRHGRTKLHTFVSGEADTWAESRYAAEMVPAVRHEPWHWAGHRAPLRDMGVVHLAPGVDIDAKVLRFILDALREHRRHKLDLDDLKKVVSQLGSSIANVHLLPTEPPQDGIYRTLPDGRMQREQLASGLEFEPVGEPVLIRQHAVNALYRQIAARCTTI